MTAPSGSRERAISLTEVAAELLAAELVGEMIQRWRQGERPLPEEFLARHPGLREHPQAAADLIYEELCLRQEYGPELPVEQVLRRFPQWRSQLEVLFECQRLLGPQPTAPLFPESGESLGDFLLLAELGRGARGRVFLASQLSLSDRPVVLKLLPSEVHEHLSLARLQHTHIVPLYSVQDHPERAIRSLCMPYFGGATLLPLLDALRPIPLARRAGSDLLEALDRVQGAVSLVASPGGPARQALIGATYVQAVCWIGACLAEALQYAHERGLVHLDLKPSNVLLTADGQPMLLDFHLAQEPILPDADEPQWVGGTTGYMSPEQQTALLAIQAGRNVTQVVDGRSDVYSLGIVLYEALSGGLPTLEGSPPPPLHHLQPEVGVGLSDVIGRCLALDPEDRYPRMSALADDLRRHLADLPLVGVRNRSLAERWRKWRRRRPHGVALAGMMLAVVTAAGAVALGTTSQVLQRIDQARATLDDGQRQMAEGRWEEAIATLQHGQATARGLPFQPDLSAALSRQLDLAEESRTAASRATVGRELHRLIDRVRFLYGAPHLPSESLPALEAACRTFWEDRGRVVALLTPAGSREPDPVVREDLLDLAIFWADLQVRLAPPADKGEARRQARRVLDQAEALFGPSPVLDQERALQGGPEPPAGRMAESRPATAWEHAALGRALLRSDDLDRAAEELAEAVRLQPQGLWTNFYLGGCAYRLGRFEDALVAYSVCVGAAPEAAGCFYNRALTFEALGRTERALPDYDQALRLDPTLAVAALNRGMLHYRLGHPQAALADLKQARDLGADPAAVSYNLALVHLARGDRAAARADLRRALSLAPQQAHAQALFDRLQNPEGRDEPSPPLRMHRVENSAPAPDPIPR